MRFANRLNELLVAHITSPLANSVCNRGGMLRTVRAVEQIETLPPEQVRERQLQKLKRLIERAHRQVPFYRRRFQEIGLELGDIHSLEDVRKIPPLKRENLIEHSHQLVDERHHHSLAFADSRPLGAAVPFATFRRHRLFKNTSTGSTGTPTPFYDDGTTTALAWAQELRVRSWFGLPPGAREARMARLSSEVLDKRSIGKTFRERWLNRLLLPGMNLSERDYAMCLSEMRRFQPRMLWGITTALTGFAKYLIETGEKSLGFRPELIVTWAAPLYDHETEWLQQVFDCPVSNVYGTREVGHIASRCPHGQYHVHQDHFLLEVQEHAAAADESGQILVTTLFDAPMPFIRYEVGDIGQLTNEACSCGRTLQVLKDLVGRTGDVFQTPDGRMIAPNFWCRLFMEGRHCGTIERFQIVYRSPHRATVRLVRSAQYSDDTETSIHEAFARELPGLDVDVEYATDIAQQPSGKFQMVVSEFSEDPEPALSS